MLGLLPHQHRSGLWHTVGWLLSVPFVLREIRKARVFPGGISEDLRFFVILKSLLSLN